MIDFFIRLCDDGRDAAVKYLTGLAATGAMSYFKFGEGSWSASDFFTNVVRLGGGGKVYSGILLFVPVVQNVLTITADPNGTPQVVTDVPNVPYDGSGTFVGNGTGTINYKTGEWAVTFTANVTSGVDIEAKYKYWGRPSEPKVQQYGLGAGNVGTYAMTLSYVSQDVPVARGSVTIVDGGSPPQVLTDVPSYPYGGSGTFTGDGSGVIDYERGEIDFTFTLAVATDQVIEVTYRYDGAPDQPSKIAADLFSEADPELFTFQKSFHIVPADPETGDIWEPIANHIRCRLFLELHEAIDDGNGNAPAFFEGGLFLDNDVMLAHFTFTKFRNFGDREIICLIDDVI